MLPADDVICVLFTIKSTAFIFFLEVCKIAFSLLYMNTLILVDKLLLYNQTICLKSYLSFYRIEGMYTSFRYELQLCVCVYASCDDKKKQ